VSTGDSGIGISISGLDSPFGGPALSEVGAEVSRTELAVFVLMVALTVTVTELGSTETDVPPSIAAGSGTAVVACEYIRVAKSWQYIALLLIEE
jgi:hypothetical protein